jgi:4-amino-4-deoxy-L-arabinose transferase-like glycosyltransferase
MSKQKIIILLITVTLLLATGLRLWHLNQAPPGVWYDEAYNALDALKASENNDYKIFYPKNYGREGLYINILAFSFKIFGVNNFALRLPSAFFGILTILGFYFLLKSFKLYHTTILAGVFALATSFYHLNFSRITFRAIMVPFLLIWSAYFFFEGFNSIREKISQKSSDKKYPWYKNPLLLFFLSGLLTGLGLHTYIAYRVAPLIFIILLIVFLIIYPKFLKNYWRAIIIFLIGALISAGPILFYFYQHPQAFSGRTDAVSIFNSPEMTTGQAFWKSLSYHLQSLLFIGDGNQRHNYNSFPLLPAVWSLFFSIGFVISLKEIFNSLIRRFKNKPPTQLFLPALFAQATFWTMLIPGVLSLEGIPHFLRIIGITPAIFTITVLPFNYLRRLYLHLKKSPFYKLNLWRWKIMQIAFIGLVATFLLTGISQIYLYFELWAHSPKTADAFQQNCHQFGQFIKQQPLRKENYLIMNKNISIDPNNRYNLSEKSLVFSAYPQIKKYQLYNTIDNFEELFNTVDCSNSQFILQPNTPLLVLKKIKNYCRNLKLQETTIPNSTPPIKIWILR